MANFDNKESVLTAYRSRGLQTWAVFDRQNLMQAGDTEDVLSGYIDLLMMQSGRITYTLKLYKDASPDDVTNKTEFNGAFTFCFYANQYMGGGFSGMGGNSLDARLAAIERKLNGEGPEKEPTIGSTVMGWLQDPDDVVKIMGAVKMFMGKSSAPEILQTVNALTGTEVLKPHRAGATPALPHKTEQPEMVNEQGLTKEQEALQIRLASAITRLEKCDPNLLVNLEKLAHLAETNPPMYQMAVKMLG